MAAKSSGNAVPSQCSPSGGDGAGTFKFAIVFLIFSKFSHKCFIGCLFMGIDMGCFFDILLILAIAQIQAKPRHANVYRAYFIILLGDSEGTFLV